MTFIIELKKKKKHKQTEDKASSHERPDHLNRLQIMSPSSFSSVIFVLPESRAACETDNANKVSKLLNTSCVIIHDFQKRRMFSIKL